MVQVKNSECVKYRKYVGEIPLIEQLIPLYEQYTDAIIRYQQLLGEELTETATMMAVHGWKSKRVEQGAKCRKEIKNLKDKIDSLTHNKT